MFKFIFYTIIILISFVFYYINNNSISTTEVNEKLNQFIVDIKTANTENLEKILNNNYTHIHGTGLIENKHTFINALSKKTRIYKDATISDITIESFNNMTIIRGILKINVQTTKGIIEGTNLISMVFVKENGFISIVQFQGTKLP